WAIFNTSRKTVTQPKRMNSSVRPRPRFGNGARNSAGPCSRRAKPALFSTKSFCRHNTILTCYVKSSWPRVEWSPGAHGKNSRWFCRQPVTKRLSGRINCNGRRVLPGRPSEGLAAGPGGAEQPAEPEIHELVPGFPFGPDPFRKTGVKTLKGTKKAAGEFSPPSKVLTGLERPGNWSARPGSLLIHITADRLL